MKPRSSSRVPKSVALGAVYATLDRLEDKGLICSWLSDPTPERGGRAKRYYRLETDGERALRDSVLAARRICDAVEDAWGLSNMVRKMEAGPPEVAERVVRWLLPPASREHVLGDLHERYESPRRFVLEGLKTLPFVIASRLRRTVNPGLSAFLALYFWFGVFWGPQQTHWLVAAIPALASVAALALRDVYRVPTALTPYRSAAGDVIVAALAVLATQGLCALFAPTWLRNRRCVAHRISIRLRRPVLPARADADGPASACGICASDDDAGADW